jgi:signal transduction histidine kinase
MLKDVDRIEAVIRDLLALSKPTVLDLQPQDVGRIVDDALSASDAQLRHRGIRVERRFEADVPRVMADARRLEGALLNVITNAAEAMSEGGELTVVVKKQVDGSGVGIEIRDDGTGIDAALRDRVFDPFFTTKRDGVGLGLVNAKTIVVRHGGAIELAPCETGGTRVSIVLPAVAAVARGVQPHGPLEPGSWGEDGC